MSRLSILIVVSLLSSLALVCYANENDGPFTSPTTYSSKSILSADHYDQHKTFGAADFLVSESRDNYRVILRLENYQNQTLKECSINVNVTTGGVFLKVQGISLRRYTEGNRFMLAWYDEVYNYKSGDFFHRPHVIGMDLSNCHSYDLQLSNLTIDPIIEAPDGWKFLVVINDEEYCGSLIACFRLYDENFVRSGDSSRFDNDIVWSTVKLNWGNERIWYHGFSRVGTWPSYKLRQSGGSRQAKQIDAFPRANKAMQLLAMGDVYCLVENPSVDVTVNCTLIKGPQYEEGYGDTISTWSLKFEHPVKPLALRVLNDSASGYEFVLFSGDTSCTSDESCWKLKRTRVTKDSYSTVEQKFDCIGDWKDLEIGRTIRDDKYWYACRRGDRYLYAVNQL